jgi:hypothetical protein
MRRLFLWCRARPGEWALLAALLACYPLSIIVPPAWAREGALLESLQVLVLLGGGMLAVTMFLRRRPARIAMLALWVVPVWLLLAGRELSWGRAWRASPGVDAAGAALPAHPLWFQPLVWPVAALLIGWMVYSVWHYRLDDVVRTALARRTPWLIVLVALGAAMGSTCAEGHMSCSLDMVASRSQAFEEMVELLAYVALCSLQAVVFAQHGALSPQPRMKHAVDSPVEEAS